MKKQNVLNLIKYHVERNENSFRNEAINIARYFDSIGDDQLAEYIMGLIAESNLYTPQSSDFESEFLKQVDVRTVEPLNLPLDISEDIKGIINAENHNVGINKFSTQNSSFTFISRTLCIKAKGKWGGDISINIT